MELDGTSLAAASESANVQYRDASLTTAGWTTAGLADGVASQSSGACADDIWDNGILDDAPDFRSDHSAVWTGTEMIVWGGRNVWHGLLQRGDRYDPATDTWTSISAIAAPEIMFYARNLVTSTFETTFVYILAALLYFCLSFPLARLVERFERRQRAWQ